MEKREEIKEAVKNRVIELLAQQITKEEHFDKLKDELLKDLFGEEKKERTLNADDGYEPTNDRERSYKRENGFLFNPEPVKERMERLKKENKVYSPINNFRSSLSNNLEESLCGVMFPNHFSQRDRFSENFQDRFNEKLPKMNELLKEPNINNILDLPKEILDSITKFKSKLQSESIGDIQKTNQETTNKLSELIPKKEIPSFIKEDIGKFKANTLELPKTSTIKKVVRKKKSVSAPIKKKTKVQAHGKKQVRN